MYRVLVIVRFKETNQISTNVVEYEVEDEACKVMESINMGGLDDEQYDVTVKCLW